jgi:tetratricopeptide (TPR) repeat protein
LEGAIVNKKISRIKDLEEKIAQSPDSAALHAKLGGALIQAGRTKRAESALNRALKLDPNCIPALINLGGIYLSRWDFSKCVSINQRARAVDPNLLEAHYNEGLGYLYQKKPKEMVDCFKRVIALDETHSGGHYHLAVGLLALNEIEEAKKEVAIAMQLGYKPEPALLKALEKDHKKVS